MLLVDAYTTHMFFRSADSDLIIFVVIIVGFGCCLKFDSDIIVCAWNSCANIEILRVTTKCWLNSVVYSTSEKLGERGKFRKNRIIYLTDWNTTIELLSAFELDSNTALSNKFLCAVNFEITQFRFVNWNPSHINYCVN